MEDAETKLANDEPLTSEQEAIVGALTADELSTIDDAILANCSMQFRKVAKVVGLVMNLELTDKPLPDHFYAQRVYRLVESGKLVSEGEIGSMRFCEVKLV